MNQQVQQRQEALERRQQIAALRLGGERSHTKLAAQFNVTTRTIDKDFLIIDEWWRERAAADVGAAKGQDAERIEELIAAIWTQALDPNQKGQNFYIDRVIALLDRRAKLLGLDAPLKIDRGLLEYAKQYAREHGQDEREAVATAEEILREARATA